MAFKEVLKRIASEGKCLRIPGEDNRRNRGAYSPFLLSPSKAGVPGRGKGRQKCYNPLRAAGGLGKGLPPFSG